MFILAVILFTTAIMADIESNITLNGSPSNFQQITANGGTISYDVGAGYGYQIGKYYNSSDLTNRVFRTYWYISLNDIATNATISSVTVTIYNSTSGYTLNLTLVPSQSNNAQANWSAIGNGSILHQGVQYNPNPFSSTTIKNAMQSALSNRAFIIGALSQSESNASSYASMSLSLSVTYTRPPAQISFAAHNDMDGNTGGHIGVGINVSASSRTSPYTGSAVEAQTANIQAYDDNNYNSNNGYYYLFNDSEAPQNKSTLSKLSGGSPHYFGNSSSGSYSFTQYDNGSEFVAYLSKICSTTFQGKVSVVYNNNQYNFNSGGNLGIVTGNSFTATASSYYTSSDWIDYAFNNWTWSGGSSTSVSITQTASANNTYTANCTVTADAEPMHFHFTSSDGQPITIAWTEHPNPNVTQYQVWRWIKGGSISAIGTVSRGTTSFTDNAYKQANNGGATNGLFYTVKAFFAPSGTWNNPGYLNISGAVVIQSPNSIRNNFSQESAKEIPTEYNMENYPNPFNPVTVINYQLPQNGFVTIKVYDILGREVATLVNENKTAGYYKVNFDAGRLTSGIYIYTINANNFFLSKKMLLMK
jgi:hypothetical protein